MSAIGAPPAPRRSWALPGGLWLAYVLLGVAGTLLSHRILGTLVDVRLPEVVAAHGAATRAEVADAIAADLKATFLILTVVLALALLRRTAAARVALTAFAALDLAYSLLVALPDRLALAAVGGTALVVAVIFALQVPVVAAAAVTLHVRRGGRAATTVTTVTTPARPHGTWAPEG
ncbi:MAG: hypothetical protein AB7J32_06245 [Pseudonocardia sp.]